MKTEEEIKEIETDMIISGADDAFHKWENSLPEKARIFSDSDREIWITGFLNAKGIRIESY
tara:strand:+ start:377 stop:559 length:183 start_codon:yes stop_codon:yes gene_type:complete